MAAEELWPDIRESLFGDRKIADDAGLVRLRLPEHAYDAGTVPVGLRVWSRDGRAVKRITLVIDNNPAPVAGVFDIGPAMGKEIQLSTRIRIDAFTHVRAVVELDDGTLHQSAKYIRAAGGCSSPASKDAALAAKLFGTFKIKTSGPKNRIPDGTSREARVMINHPNASGFQTDPKTGELIPTEFVDRMSIMRGDQHVLTVQGSISLSENPSLRFHYVIDGSENLIIGASDTSGRDFGTSYSVARKTKTDLRNY